MLSESSMLVPKEGRNYWLLVRSRQVLLSEGLGQKLHRNGVHGGYQQALHNTEWFL